MTFTRSESRDFAESLGIPEPTDLLDRAIAWVSRHCAPEDVFDDDELAGWARANGFEREE